MALTDYSRRVYLSMRNPLVGKGIIKWKTKLKLKFNKTIVSRSNINSRQFTWDLNKHNCCRFKYVETIHDGFCPSKLRSKKLIEESNKHLKDIEDTLKVRNHFHIDYNDCYTVFQVF